MAGGKNKIHLHPNACSNGLDKNPQNINKTGLNRKTISSVNKELEEKGVTEATPNDIKSCYLRIINLSEEEIKTLSEDTKQPALVNVVSKAIMKGKGLDIIEKLLDRAIGKAQQHTDLTTAGEKLNITISKANGNTSE